MTAPALRFAHMDFHSGENVTVRDGQKWYAALDVGCEIALCSIDGEDIRPARVVAKDYMPFRFIRARDVQDEHDPACDTYLGLLFEMQSAYPGFEETNWVSVIRFELL